MKMSKRSLKGPRMCLRVSRAAFQEIALLLCSTEYGHLCVPKEDEGEIAHVYLPSLTRFEPDA